MTDRLGTEIDGRQMAALDRRVGIIGAQCLDRAEWRDGSSLKLIQRIGKRTSSLCGLSGLPRASQT